MLVFELMGLAYVVVGNIAMVGAMAMRVERERSDPKLSPETISATPGGGGVRFRKEHT